MMRWLAALILGLFLVGHSVAALAGEEGGDPPGSDHGHGDHNGQTGDSDRNGDLHSGH